MIRVRIDVLKKGSTESVDSVAVLDIDNDGKIFSPVFSDYDVNLYFSGDEKPVRAKVRRHVHKRGAVELVKLALVEVLKQIPVPDDIY